MTHKCCNYCDCHCGRGNIREKLCNVLKHQEKCHDGWSGWRVERNNNCTGTDDHQRYDIYIRTLNKEVIHELEACSGLCLVYVEPQNATTIHAIFDESWDF